MQLLVRTWTGHSVGLAFTKGTYYSSVDTYADERVWYSEEVSQIPNYEMTKNGFVVLTLPGSVSDGDYISVMGTGLFHVSDKERASEAVGKGEKK